MEGNLRYSGQYWLGEAVDEELKKLKLKDNGANKVVGSATGVLLHC